MPLHHYLTRPHQFESMQHLRTCCFQITTDIAHIVCVCVCCLCLMWESSGANAREYTAHFLILPRWSAHQISLESLFFPWIIWPTDNRHWQATAVAEAKRRIEKLDGGERQARREADHQHEIAEATNSWKNTSRSVKYTHACAWSGNGKTHRRMHAELRRGGGSARLQRNKNKLQIQIGRENRNLSSQQRWNSAHKNLEMKCDCEICVIGISSVFAPFAQLSRVFSEIADILAYKQLLFRFRHFIFW